jgi:hypothetical protein
MRARITSQEAEEVRLLVQEYQRAIVFALETMRAHRIDAASLPKILTQDAKAGRAIQRIREIFGLYPCARSQRPRAADGVNAELAAVERIEQRAL